jgi:hypothetical protein
VPFLAWITSAERYWVSFAKHPSAWTWIAPSIALAANSLSAGNRRRSAYRDSLRAAGGTQRRLERMETNLTAIQFQTAGISKSLTDPERLDGRMLETQHAQQRAIDDLARRIAKLERQINPRDRQ